MPATVLSAADAAKKKFVLVEGDKGGQAVHDVVTAMRAARRSGSANTKTRSEVKASNRKPWRQKGTGRARAGSFASPIWRGGGVVFGPKPRDYSKQIPKNVRRLAFRKALSARIEAGDVMTAAGFDIEDGRTSSFVKELTGLTDESRVLVISDEFQPATYRAARNFGPTLLVRASDVNVEELLYYKKIIITEPAMALLAERTAK